MKFFSTFAFIGLIASSQVFAWTQVATCGTGDAVAGVDVFTDGADFIVQIHSQDDTRAPDEYRTNQGTVNQESYDVPAIMDALYAGNPQTLTLSKPDSFEFGGAISKAALLNLKVHGSFSYDRNSQLASQGAVLSLFCNKPQN